MAHTKRCNGNKRIDGVVGIFVESNKHDYLYDSLVYGSWNIIEYAEPYIPRIIRGMVQPELLSVNNGDTL